MPSTIGLGARTGSTDSHHQQVVQSVGNVPDPDDPTPGAALAWPRRACLPHLRSEKRRILVAINHVVQVSRRRAYGVQQHPPRPGHLFLKQGQHRSTVFVRVDVPEHPVHHRVAGHFSSSCVSLWRCVWQTHPLHDAASSSRVVPFVRPPSRLSPFATIYKYSCSPSLYATTALHWFRVVGYLANPRPFGTLEHGAVRPCQVKLVVPLARPPFLAPVCRTTCPRTRPSSRPRSRTRGGLFDFTRVSKFFSHASPTFRSTDSRPPSGARVRHTVRRPWLH